MWNERCGKSKVRCVDLGRLKYISVLVSGTDNVRSRCCKSDKLTLNSNCDFISSREVEEETGCEATKTVQVVITVRQICTPLIEVWLPYVHKTLLFSRSLTQEVCSPRSTHTNTLFHHFLLTLEILIKALKHIIIFLRNSKELPILV